MSGNNATVLFKEQKRAEREILRGGGDKGKKKRKKHHNSSYTPDAKTAQTVAPVAAPKKEAVVTDKAQENAREASNNVAPVLAISLAPAEPVVEVVKWDEYAWRSALADACEAHLGQEIVASAPLLRLMHAYYSTHKHYPYDDSLIYCTPAWSLYLRHHGVKEIMSRVGRIIVFLVSDGPETSWQPLQRELLNSNEEYCVDIGFPYVKHANIVAEASELGFSDARFERAIVCVQRRYRKHLKPIPIAIPKPPADADDGEQWALLRWQRKLFPRLLYTLIRQRNMTSWSEIPYAGAYASYAVENLASIIEEKYEKYQKHLVGYDLWHRFQVLARLLTQGSLDNWRNIERDKMCFLTYVSSASLGARWLQDWPLGVVEIVMKRLPNYLPSTGQTLLKKLLSVNSLTLAEQCDLFNKVYLEDLVNWCGKRNIDHDWFVLWLRSPHLGSDFAHNIRVAVAKRAMLKTMNDFRVKVQAGQALYTQSFATIIADAVKLQPEHSK